MIGLINSVNNIFYGFVFENLNIKYQNRINIRIMIQKIGSGHSTMIAKPNQIRSIHRSIRIGSDHAKTRNRESESDQIRDRDPVDDPKIDP